MTTTLAFIGIDPLYLLISAPALLLGMWAQMRVKSAYARASRLGARSGFSGRDAAQSILDAYSISNVGIEESHGMLSDHYDPKARKLRLSHDVFHGHSLAALGIAAHEAGHAIQHREGYAPLKLRSGLVPLAMVGSNLSWLLVMVGLMVSAATKGGNMLGTAALWGGIILFSTVVLFQMITLPVEFDASNRAKKLLASSGMVNEAEAVEVKRVLDAAAWTYIAATVSAVLTLLYFVIRANQSRN